MPEQIYIGNFTKGQVTYKLPFNIDNDAFGKLYNFYSWRGRVKKRRGTALLGRVQLQVQSVLTATPPKNWQIGQLTVLDLLGAGSCNLLTATSAPSDSNIATGSITLSDGTNTYTEPSTPDGTLVGVPNGTGTINYLTGAVSITGGAPSGILIGTYDYNPNLPILGLEDLSLNAFDFPKLLTFDQEKAYQYSEANNKFYNVSFYKGTQTKVKWTGTDYQQFFSANFQNAFFVTNNKPQMHLLKIASITTANPTVITTILNHGLITGDYVWFNEITGADAGLLNKQTFQVTVTGLNTFTVALNTGGKTINNDGMFQTLTSTPSSSTGDGIRWYDGDPTNGSGLPNTPGVGWVNFAPPLTNATVSINDSPAGTYYLCGALAIVPYKDRLLFFAPWICTSTSAPIQLPDTVIFSWNGTPYYASPVPTNQTYDTTAYYVDQTGKGGWIAAGVQQPIVTVNLNEDVLLVGLSGRQTRFVYTGNDINPFLFYSISAELGSSATFSSISLDKGCLSIGTYGIAMTDQQSAQRIDLDIPDTIYQVLTTQNGNKRVNSARDFFREWVYFTYPVQTNGYENGQVCYFPLTTLMFNYRDNTWAIFNENYTAHGAYYRSTKNNWKSIGKKFGSWAQWKEPWNSGVGNANFPNVVAGNPQGYVLIKGIGTAESISGYIQAITPAAGNVTTLKSHNHCLQIGEYIYLQNAIGLSGFNNQVVRVLRTLDADTVVVDLNSTTWSGTYLGNASYQRLCQPLMQTKQFNPYWNMGRKTRLGAQKYLFDTTANGQVTVNIYTSMNPDNPWNDGPIVPNVNSNNNSLIYSNTLYTCPESTNIGLTPANTNLQMPEAITQRQIWHRMNTSLIGDTIQLGITLSDAQMRNYTLATSEIALHAVVMDIYPSQNLA